MCMPFGALPSSLPLLVSWKFAPAGHNHSALVSFVFLCLLATASFTAAQNATMTMAQQISATPTASWVYNPIAENKLITSPGGTSTPRQIAQWPALANMGISQTSFVMNGCALRPPHTHMHATGLLYVISAANLSVGFITEPGQGVVNYIQTGASTIFPQGLVHYQQNNDCKPAYYTISYNSEEPGTQVTAPAFGALPASVLTSSLGAQTSSYQGLLSALPKQAFISDSDPDCVARCQAMGIDNMAPAPAVMPPVTSAGR